MADWARWEQVERAVGPLLLWWHGLSRGPTGEDPSLTEFAAIGVLGLALWRAAEASEWSAEDVPLAAAKTWLDGAYAERLWDEPLPPVAGMILEPWDRVHRRGPLLLGIAAEILAANIEDGRARDRALGPTPADADRAEVLLGPRVRDLASTAGRRAGAPRMIAARVGQAVAELRSGGWEPTDAQQRIARMILPSLISDPDHPEVAEAVDQPAWLQRVCRLAGLASMLSVVQEAVTGQRVGDTYDRALADLRGAAGDLEPVADELETSWAARPAGQPLTAWERPHVPVGLRLEVAGLERAVNDLAQLSATLAFYDQER